MFLPIFCLAQVKVHGIVKDANSALPIPFVSVALKDSTNTWIAAYTSTDELGHFTLLPDQQGVFNLHFMAFGYATQVIPLRLEGKQEDQYLAVNMPAVSFDLGEVLIVTERPMRENGDTISFKVDHYTQGNEQTVEDLLKRIPGLNIDEEGTIKVGNQEIEKLMVEGDDFFEKGYRTLSKNMPAYPIEEVQVVRNYSNNAILKGIEESEKVALNLIGRGLQTRLVW